MGNWWRATYRYWRWIFFIQEFPLAFVGSMLAGFMPMSGDNRPNINQKKVNIKIQMGG